MSVLLRWQYEQAYKPQLNVIKYEWKKRYCKGTVAFWYV
jgi:hypothetical protein